MLLDPIETGRVAGHTAEQRTTKASNYGVYLGNRYKGFPNIVWISGNDFQTWRTTSDNNLVKQVMAGIASVDSAHLQTLELDYDTSYSNQDSVVGPDLGINGAYTYFETYDEVLQAYNSSPTLPVIMLESNYEFENNTGVFSGVTNAFILREQQYWTMLSGGLRTNLWKSLHGDIIVAYGREFGYARSCRIGVFSSAVLTVLVVVAGPRPESYGGHGPAAELTTRLAPICRMPPIAQRLRPRTQRWR